MVLSTSRQIGMSGPQPISLTDINSYCEFQGLADPEDRVEFLFHVQKLDVVFMQEWKARHPSSGKPQTPPNSAPEHLG